MWKTTPSPRAVKCGCARRPLPVMSGHAPPSSVESRDTSGKKLRTALTGAAREPPHHHRQQHRDGTERPGVFTASWRTPVNGEPEPRSLPLFVLSRRPDVSRAPPPRRGRRRGGRGGRGGSNRERCVVLLRARAEWRTARRRRYRWRSIHRRSRQEVTD